MKALIVDTPGHMSVRQIPRPKLGDYDALVQVRVCGICNSTDMHLLDGKQPFHNQYPALLGHEGVGEIVAVGKRVRSLWPGMRITRPCAILPGETHEGIASAWGGFADYGFVRDRLALAADGHTVDSEHFMVKRQNIVADGISDIEAALAISLAEIASWVDKLPSLRGKHVVILGTGIAGLSMAFFSKLAGAQTVIVLGRRPERLAHARACGADHAFFSGPENIAMVHEVTGGGADWLFEAAGDANAVAQWLPVLRAGGSIAIYGVAPGHAYTLPLLCAPADFVFRVPAPEDHLLYPWVCELIRTGGLDTSLFHTHTWKWPGDAQRAFDTVRRGQVVKGFLLFT